MKSFKSFLEEEEVSIPSKKVSIATMRAQPFHNGHAQMIDHMKFRPIILLVKGKGTSEDKTKNPFDADYQEYLIKKVFPGIEVRRVNNSNLKPIVYHIEKTGESLVGEIVAGDDRIDSYRRQIGKDRPDIIFTESSRVTSATKVREAIRNGDKKTFEKLVPRVLHSEWDTMREQISN